MQNVKIIIGEGVHKFLVFALYNTWMLDSHSAFTCAALYCM